MIHRAMFHPYLGRAERMMILTITALCLACSQPPEGQPPVYPFKEKVLYKGKPISGGVVVFEMEGGDPPPSKSAQGSGPLRATGRIDVDGSFRLMAFPGARECRRAITRSESRAYHRVPRQTSSMSRVRQRKAIRMCCTGDTPIPRHRDCRPKWSRIRRTSRTFDLN